MKRILCYLWLLPMLAGSGLFAFAGALLVSPRLTDYLQLDSLAVYQYFLVGLSLLAASICQAVVHKSCSALFWLSAALWVVFELTPKMGGGDSFDMSSLSGFSYAFTLALVILALVTSPRLKEMMPEY